MSIPRVLQPSVAPPVWITISGLLLLLAPLAGASSSGPPDGLTGAPGEGTCHGCHASFPLNSGDGVLSIEGPEHYLAGQTYTVTVTRDDPGQTRWGFEISPLEIGECAIIDPINTQLSISQGKSYVKQTSAGTFNGTQGPVSWSFDWTAPSVNPPDEVIFYAAGNAANGNGSTGGDYIYTTTFTSTYVSTSVEEPPGPRSRLALQAWPSPCRVGTLLSFALAEESDVRLEVFDVNGRPIADLLGGPVPGGRRQVYWDCRDQEGRRVPEGIYLCRLRTAFGAATRALVVLD